MNDFPWTFDQLQRYNVLKEYLATFYEGKEIRLLDVGGLSPDRVGTSFWTPITKIHPGHSISIDIHYFKIPDFIQGDGIHLPFKNQAFDVAVSLDVLEHIPKEKREAFIAEICRVSKDSVVISAPFADKHIEQTESLLLEQMEKLYGATQQQLKEHKEYGLPGIQSTAQSLAGHTLSTNHFSYGSLHTWLPFQTLKNTFMFKRNTADIHALMDNWMAAQDPVSEEKAPFSRHFWFGSKVLAKEDLDKGIQTIRGKLKNRPNHTTNFSDLVRFNTEIVDFFSKKRVSAVIVSFGSNDCLFESLQRILTQKVDFDLEVVVWNIGGSKSLESDLAHQYPGIKVINSPEGETTSNALLKTIDPLIGDYILLLSEDILLSSDSVQQFFDTLENEEPNSLLSPKILGKKSLSTREKNGLVKADDSSPPSWILSECLFFKKLALFSRKLIPAPLDRKNIFFWEKSEKSQNILYVPSITVKKKSPSLKILHCMHNYYPARGGSEWLMQSISEKLAEKGHQVEVLATTAYSTEDYFLPGRGKNLLPHGKDDVNSIPLTRIPFTRKGAAVLNILRSIATRWRIPFGNKLRMFAWGPRSRPYYRQILAQKNIDLIVACPLPNANIWYAKKAAQKKNIPFVIIPCFHTEDRYSFHNPLYFKMLREADAVITLTEWERDYIIKQGNIKTDKIQTIGVGIAKDSPSESIDIKKKYGIAQKNIVLFLGQHGRHKGILELIDAMTFVWKESKDTALVIAGNPTAHTADIEYEIATLKPAEQKKVYLIKGFSESEKRAILQVSDIFVSVSPFESFGIVFLEAWREKLPVIGCQRGASAKLIDEFKDGLLVSDGNPVELAGAIQELLASPETRNLMGLYGYKKVQNYYSWEKIIDKWESVYYEAV